MNIKTEYVNTPGGSAPIHRANYAGNAANAQSTPNESTPTEFLSSFPGDAPGDDAKTVVLPSAGSLINRINKLCVGWVVAIKGPVQGKSFALHLGQNHVGSESRNDIVISKADDPGISGYNHVNIEYDQKVNKYFISRGNEGHSLAYINGERLSGGQEQELSRGDFIELSEQTILRFLPFCDEQFNWSSTEPKQEK